ncbi:MAG TPA: M36 family metallopeptidase, partial [Anaerolineae bacterium]|nr:M36 family metallopeptidase [Anaerolineae bacterium]
WPDALDPDIIVHEYGHALLHDLAPHWGGGEMEAIGEGFGDYLAASLSAEASADPACIGEWDSRGNAAEANACLRRVDHDRQYPYDLAGDAHADGEIWSRVLWDVRAAAGHKAADVLALESSFYLPPAASLVEAGQALLDADANLFDGLHRDAIVQALQTRGLAPLPAPVLASPVGGEMLMPGGLWAVAWQAQTDLPVSYDLEWSLHVSDAGTRLVNFVGGLPEDFTARGHAPWQASAGAARSGRIDHGQRSSLVLSVEMVKDGQLSFRNRVDSEQGYDRFQFLVDGQALLHVSGQTAWQTFSTTLPAGQHELVWRYSKDSTLSSGQDAAWIDDLQIEQASLAEWRPAELDPSRSVNGDVLWRVPNSASSDASLRVRARLGAVTGPWSASGPLTIDQPTAVSLASFEAGVGQALAGWPALLALASLLALGAGWGAVVVRRRG